MLDEGIDVPEVDVGINVAAEKNEKQLTQRQGRILRRGGDYVPVFHHFVVKEEMTHYADLSSVTPKRGSPTPRIEESLPVSVGTIDIWDIYNSANPAILEQIREADSVNELDMTGEEWWLQIYLDKHRSAEDHRMFLEKLDGL